MKIIFIDDRCCQHRSITRLVHGHLMWKLRNSASYQPLYPCTAQHRSIHLPPLPSTCTSQGNRQFIGEPLPQKRLTVAPHQVSTCSSVSTSCQRNSCPLPMSTPGCQSAECRSCERSVLRSGILLRLHMWAEVLAVVDGGGDVCCRCL